MFNDFRGKPVFDISVSKCSFTLDEHVSTGSSGTRLNEVLGNADFSLAAAKLRLRMGQVGSHFCDEPQQPTGAKRCERSAGGGWFNACPRYSLKRRSNGAVR